MSVKGDEVARRLRALGWRPVARDLTRWRHPQLHTEWTTRDAMRLETERSGGDVSAVRLLGSRGGAQIS